MFPKFHICIFKIYIYTVYICSCGSVVRALRLQRKGCGFDSQGTHVLTKKCITLLHCKLLWIKASAKCINVNVNIYNKTYIKNKLITLFGIL